MKKNILIISAFFILAVGYLSSQNSEIQIQDFIESGKVSIFKTKRQSIINKINNLNLKEFEYMWMPDFRLSEKMDYYYFPVNENLVHRWNNVSTVSWLQRLPLGIVFNVDLFSVKRNLNTSYYSQFDFLCDLNVQIPLMSYIWGFGDEIIWKEKNGQKILSNYIFYDNQMSEKEVLNILYSGISEFLYNSEMISYYNKKIKLLDDEIFLLNNMLLNGLISFEDLLNKKNEKDRVIFELQNYEETFSNIKFNLSKIGCSVNNINFNLNQWVDYLKSNINLDDDSIFDFSNYKLQNALLEKELISKVDYCDNFPKLNISLDFSPGSKNNRIVSNNENILESFYAYWPSLDYCDIQLTIWTEIQLSHYDSLHRKKEQLNYEFQHSRLEKAELLSAMQAEESRRIQDLESARLSMKTSYRIYQQEKDLLPSYQKMYTDQIISKQDLSKIHLYIEELYLNYIKNYLYCINLINSFY